MERRAKEMGEQQGNEMKEGERGREGGLVHIYVQSLFHSYSFGSNGSTKGCSL